VRIIESARRHGIADEDIWHVISNALRYLEHDEIVMALGPDRAGNLREVGIANAAGSDPVIVHADVLREKFYPYL
jgi:hypothetical protein